MHPEHSTKVPFVLIVPHAIPLLQRGRMRRQARDWLQQNSLLTAGAHNGCQCLPINGTCPVTTPSCDNGGCNGIVAVDDPTDKLAQCQGSWSDCSRTPTAITEGFCRDELYYNSFDGCSDKTGTCTSGSNAGCICQCSNSEPSNPFMGTLSTFTVSGVTVNMDDGTVVDTITISGDGVTCEQYATASPQRYMLDLELVGWNLTAGTIADITIDTNSFIIGAPSREQTPSGSIGTSQSMLDRPCASYDGMIFTNGYTDYEFEGKRVFGT
jgi:hypothetical protein